MKCLASVEEEVKSVKKDAVNLKKLSKEIDSEFERIEVTYFTKKTVKSWINWLIDLPYELSYFLLINFIEMKN